MNGTRRQALATLDSGHRAAVAALANACEAGDGFRSELHEAVESSGRTPAHYLVFDGRGLVAYLGLFVFYEDAAELVGLVRPDARRGGVMSGLFEEAQGTCRALGLARAVLLVPGASAAGRGFAGHVGGQLGETEYRMQCRAADMPGPWPALTLRSATVADAAVMAGLDVASFASDGDAVLARYRETLGAARRRAWVLEEDGEAVGKIHARLDAGGVAVIHDLCIEPRARRGGRGQWMIATATAALLDAGAAVVELDVAADNRAALRVYERCGFAVVAANEYWSVPVS